MIVETILAAKGRKVHTISPGTTLAEAIQKLVIQRVSALVVSEDGVNIAGILSDRDVIRMLSVNSAAALEQTVGQAMTAEVITCRPSDMVAGIMQTMTQRRIRHIPVVDGEQRLCGLISIGDVVKHRVDEIQLEATAMRDYIAGSR